MAGRVIGKRRERPSGLRWPTQAEIDASMGHALAAPRVVPQDPARLGRVASEPPLGEFVDVTG